jgi:hypothetical protein
MSDIQKVAVFDARILNKPNSYAVEKGAVSITNSPFQAISANASQHSFQLQVPSETVYLDKAVEWTATCGLSFTATIADTVAVNEPVVRWGVDMALAPFPLHSLVNTLSCTINDATVTTNTADTIREVLRLSSSKKNKMQRTCPTYLDNYQSYNDAYGSSNNPLNGFSGAVDNDSVPNGAYWNVWFTAPDGVPLTSKYASGDRDYTSGGVVVTFNQYGIPLVKTTGVAPAPVVKTLVYPIFIGFQSTEKLMCSPFIWSDTHEAETGLFGIQNVQVLANLVAPSFVNTSGRVLRTTTKGARTLTNIAYQTNPFPSSRIDCQFLSPSLDLPLPAKSQSPYMEFPRYVNNFTFTDAVASGASTVLNSQTITLPTIPDLLIIYAKPTSYLATDADYYYPITNINVNFDNYSGLLSSHTPSELYSMSVQNGLDMDWNQWNGSSIVQGLATAENNPFVSLTGGFLVLKPSKDITLQSGQAPSLVGNYTFQFNATVYNNTQAPITGCSLWVITANSGYFETIKGSSRIVKGVLTERDIIESTNTQVTRTDLNRYVGGSFFNSMGNMISKAIPIIKSVAPAVKQFLPQQAQDIMGQVGLGRGRKGLSARLM